MSDPGPSLPPELSATLAGLDRTGRAARELLLRHLLDNGHTAAELLAATATNRLAMLPVADELRDDGERTLDQIAAEYGVDPDHLVATRQAMGLLVVRGQAIYGTALELHAVRLRDVLATGLGLEALVAYNYLIGTAAASIAAGARDITRTLLELVDPDGTEHTRAMHTAQFAKALAPVLTDVVSYALNEHLREVSRREVATALLSSEAETVTEMSIAFADLVGFTALGERLRADELGAVAVRLANLADESLVGRTSVVKTMGDGVMFAGATTGDVVASTRRLAGACEHAGLPPLRVGVAHGPALPRGGDWYGATVNRASRLCVAAAPDQLVADDAVHAANASSWTDLGPIEVRGLSEPVHCWSLPLR